MKKIIAALVLSSALISPNLAMAKQVKFTANLKSYGGKEAYLALYVTDAKGKYAGSLWMAGTKSKYYKHLTGWHKATGGNKAEVNGITGASVGSGRKLEITLDLADAIFDAGYQLHIDSSVEDKRDVPNEVVVPLTKGGSGKTVSGRRYVADFKYSM